MFDKIFVKTFPGFLSIRDSKYRIVYLNENFREWIGSYTDIDPLGKTNQEIAALVPPNVADVFLQCHDTSLCWQKNCNANECLKKVIPFKDSEGIEANTQYFDTLKYGLNIAGESHIFTVGYDVTEMYLENQTYLKTLERIAYIDELTGEQSFNKFEEEAQRLLEQPENTSYILIKMDIENFKLINKTFGYEMGDRILKVVSDAIKSILSKERGIFARLSVDEFVILHNYFDKNRMAEIQKMFLSNFYALMGDDFDYNIRFKAGIYIIEDDPAKRDNIKELLELVNFAHRTAKQGFTDDIVFYDDSFSQNALYQKDIENRMVKALSNKEFAVFLQPKYHLQDESMGGAEALVRWQTNDGTLIYPNDFISIFEKNGFITKLDMYMLKNVCRIISGWIAEGISPIAVSVNFSKRHLNNKNFVSHLCEIVDSYHIKPKWIEVEFTETAIYENMAEFEQVLMDLHKSGFTVSMDDFGSGYSSLGLLKNLPFDVIKIDRSFFVNQKDEKRSKTVLGSVMDMAENLGIRTVAEGVEEKVHLDLLRELHCDMVQGYYFAKPMPEKEFILLLKRV